MHDESASFEQAFLLGDRATNRYWQVGPVQFEMARIFSRRDLDWTAACAALRERFDEKISDDEITAAYQEFETLGLVELSEDAVVKGGLSAGAYRRALRLSGVRSQGLDKAAGDVRSFVMRAERARTAPKDLVALALRLQRDHPGDAVVQRVVQAFHRGLQHERVVKSNAHLPALLRWMRVQVPLFDPHEQIARWLPRLRFVFSWWFFALTLLVAFAGFSTYLDRAREVHQRLVLVSGNLTLLFCCTVTMLVIHEYAHAFACKHYGGEVHEIGIIVFLFFIPAAYCDVSDAHLFKSKRQKLIVTLAGTWSTFVLASLGALIWGNTIPTALLNHVGLVLMATGYATVLTNLNPLLPLDGYFFLSDWLGIDNLRDRAPEYAKAYLVALITGKARPVVTPREHRVFFVYFVVGSLYQVFYMLLSLGFGWLILVRGGTLLGFSIFVLLVYLFYVRTYWLKVVRLWKEARTKQLFAYVAGAAAVLSVLVFVPFSNSVVVPVTVRKMTHVATIAPEVAVIDAIVAPRGSAVKAGDVLFRLGTVDRSVLVTAPVAGFVEWEREWLPNEPVEAGAVLAAVVKGYAAEGELPERHVRAALDAQTAEATVLGDRVLAQSVSVESRARAPGERPRPLLHVGILAPRENPLTLSDGMAGRVVLSSSRSISLWRRLWGAEWDKVIVDVWRLF
ncbi:MAG: M50 family metallopeptidase [Deltaproteobacteria bacterium]|nr:M50 family metallopeptidase [Deltaproteobacteria bacterium]